MELQGLQGGPEPILALAGPSAQSEAKVGNFTAALCWGERGFVGHKEAGMRAAFQPSQPDRAGARARLEAGEMMFQATKHRAGLSGCSCISDLRSQCQDWKGLRGHHTSVYLV